MTVSTNVTEFNLKIDQFSKTLEIEFYLVLKKVALEIFTGIVLKTPVDTGMARASWVIGVNGQAAPATISQSLAAKVVSNARAQKGAGVSGARITRDAATQMSLARVAGLNVKKGDSVIVISNYLPYIQFLEKGSSTQAPAGMVRITLEEAAARLRAGFK